MRSPDPLSAHAVWIQTPKATTGLARRPARGGSAPGGAEQDFHPQRRRRVRGQQLGGPLVGGQRRPGIAHHRAVHLAAAGPGHRLPFFGEKLERRLPLALEVGVLAEPAEGLGQLQAKVRGFGVAAHRLGPEPGRLRHRAQRPGVPGRPLPARPGQVVAAGPVQVAGHLGGHLVRCRSGRLDGQRQLLVAAPLLPQVGPDRLGEQRVPEAQPAAHPDDQTGVQDALFRGVAVGQRQIEVRRGQLGRGQLAARRGEQFGQVPCRAAQHPDSRPDGGPQVLRRGIAARGEGPGTLHRQQRVAVGGANDLVDGAVGQVGHAAGHRGELDRGQRTELELGDLDTAAGQVGEQRVGVRAVRLVAAGQHEQHRPGGQPPADVRAQLHTGGVGPVHVLGHQEYGPAAAAHSTSRSTASNTRSRSSSGEDTGGGGWSRPSRVAISGASRPSSAGQSASSGGVGTSRASCGSSSCQVASGAAPPTSTPAPIAVLAPAFSARRASSATRRVLPIPASLVIRTTRPCPARAAVQAAMSVRSSAARP